MITLAWMVLAGLALHILGYFVTKDEDRVLRDTGRAFVIFCGIILAVCTLLCSQ